MLDNQYFKKFLAEKEIDLKQHMEIDKLCNLQLDPKAFEEFAEKHRHEATVKWYHPRPFLNAETNAQAINANWIGYNKQNTTETNWGLKPEHNKRLKEIIGRDNFDLMGIDPNETLLRLLEYMPGHCLPLHYDGFEGFKKIYKKDNSTRFFVAVSDWDWGHVLQVHNNIISNWNPGDTYIIPAGVCHASANFGIAPKYTLTVTGVRR